MDYVFTCIWSWKLSTKYHELIIEFVVCVPQNWLLYLPHSKYRRYLHVLYHEYSYINLCQFLGHQAQLKRLVASKNMKSYVEFVLKIWKDFNMCMRVLAIVYSKDIYNNPIEYFFLFINLGMEGSGFGQASCPSWTKG